MAIVFISHSSQDNKKVQEIIKHMKIKGFDSIFLDHDEKKGIKTGEHWEQRLYSEIKRSHAMLLVLSPSWIESKWCFAEYTQAKALGKEIIPIIIDHGVDNEVVSWIDSYIQKSDLTKEDDALTRVIDRLKEISIHTQRGFSWDKHRAPYPGMMSFEEEDAAIFFGREDETREIIEKLNAMKNRNAPKFLNIVAASGMGKSSFLKAGVIPQLKRSYSDRWIVMPSLRPTKRPLYAFAKLIASTLKKELAYKSIYESLQKENYQETLDDIATEIEFTSPGSVVLFPIDQAEELYSLGDKKEKEEFFKCLTYLLDEKEHFFTIWTLRADFLKEFQSDKTLKTIYKTMELFALSPLRKENVTSIIKEPAVVAGINIDERLIDKIKEDMQTTDALPLLALGLSELYQKYGKDGHLTLEEYKSLAAGEENPLEQIVKQKADEAIRAFKKDKDALKALKEAFIPHLIRVNSKNEYIKKVALWEDLPKQSYAILEELVKSRLLIKKTEDDKEIIEIAHEALIRKWPLLLGWLQEEHEFLVGKSQLEIAYNEYQQEETKNKYKTYLTGLRLQKASSWLGEHSMQLTNKEKVYIRESILFNKKQANKKKTIYSSVFVLVLLFGIFSAWQWMESKKHLKVAIEERKKAITEKERAENAENKIVINKYIENFLIKDVDRNAFLNFLKPLIVNSKILNKDEKKFWFNKSGTMSDYELSKLFKLLTLESPTLRGIIYDNKHKPISISPISGYLGKENKGKKGLQRTYNKWLSKGISLHLNINYKFQKAVEKIIDTMKKDIDADEIIVGVMESATGKVLSLASTERYDPSHFIQKDIPALNPKFSEYAHEAGSVLKPITLAIALDHKVVTPDTWFNTFNGRMKIGEKRTITDDHKFASLTAADIIIHSSNVGISQISWKLTGKEFREGLVKFGIAKPSGLDLSRDLPGSLKPLYKLNHKIHRANSSYGYGMMVTFAQLLKAYSAFNNNGVAVTPRIADYLQDAKDRQYKVEPKVGDIQPIGKKAANQIHDILIDVVQNGTGKKAKYPGLVIGGKTGTAHIAKNGRYVREYHSSFYGFANDKLGNKYTIGVLIIRAKEQYKYFASQSAVPTFKEIVNEMVNEKILIVTKISNEYNRSITYKEKNLIVSEKLDELERRSNKRLNELNTKN